DVVERVTVGIVGRRHHPDGESAHVNGPTIAAAYSPMRKKRSSTWLLLGGRPPSSGPKTTRARCGEGVGRSRAEEKSVGGGAAAFLHALAERFGASDPLLESIAHDGLLVRRERGVEREPLRAYLLVERRIGGADVVRDSRDGREIGLGLGK